MKKYLTETIEFIKKPSFTVSLILTLIMGYGFTLTHFSVGIDDLTRTRYITGQLFAQGRFSSSFLSYVLRFTEAYPFAEDFLAIVLLFCAAAVFCVVLKNASQNSMSYAVYPMFACLFVSYPLINEIFIYNGASINVCVGYLLTGIAMLIMNHTFELSGKKRIKFLIFCALICFFLMSLYESFILVYVLCVCIVLVLKNLYAAKETPFKATITEILFYAAPLAVGIAAEFVFGKAVIAVFGLSGGYAANTLILPEHFSVSTIISALYTIFRRCVLSGIGYFPVFIFAACLLISAAQCIVICIKRKNISYILFYAGIYLSLFALGLIKFGDMKYRTSQTFALFTSFTIILALQYFLTLFSHRGAKYAGYATVVLCGLLVFYQAADLSRHFSDDYQRWEEERNVLINVGNQIAAGEYSHDKPVIFIGEYTLSDEIMQNKFLRSDDEKYKLLKKLWTGMGGDLDNTDFNETYVLGLAQNENGSVITWAVDGFEECNTELLNIYRYLGYSFKQGSYERYLEVAKMSEELPSYPESGFISELDDCIVVNFGSGKK